MSRTLALLPFTLALAATPSVAAAQERPLSAAWVATIDDVHHLAYRAGVAALDQVNATPQQRREVRAAASRLATGLAPLEKEAVHILGDLHSAWTAPTVEAAAVAEVRVAGVSWVDAVSHEGADFIVTVGGVLTREQRREVATLVRATARDAIGR